MENIENSLPENITPPQAGMPVQAGVSFFSKLKTKWPVVLGALGSIAIFVAIIYATYSYGQRSQKVQPAPILTPSPTPTPTSVSVPIEQVVTPASAPPLTTPLATPTVGVALKWKEYESPYYEYKIRYPEGWKLILGGSTSKPGDTFSLSNLEQINYGIQFQLLHDAQKVESLEKYVEQERNFVNNWNASIKEGKGQEGYFELLSMNSHSAVYIEKVHATEGEGFTTTRETDLLGQDGVLYRFWVSEDAYQNYPMVKSTYDKLLEYFLLDNASLLEGQ